jgi:hypothetical protein
MQMRAAEPLAMRVPAAQTRRRPHRTSSCAQEEPSAAHPERKSQRTRPKTKPNPEQTGAEKPAAREASPKSPASGEGPLALERRPQGLETVRPRASRGRA